MSNENDQPSLRPHQEEAFRDLANLDRVRSTVPDIALPAHLGKAGLEGSTRPDSASTTDEQLPGDFKIGISATPDRVASDQRSGRVIRQDSPTVEVQMIDYTQHAPDK